MLVVRESTYNLQPILVQGIPLYESDKGEVSAILYFQHL